MRDGTAGPRRRVPPPDLSHGSEEFDRAVTAFLAKVKAA
ncbi:hypothetical protein QO012_002355 [Methylobacterium aerolatum]|uniref:Uncharacterized protein n=1 Tax=Methylobacterium aerolatum TaxID=418708 RepID=A0ABU0I1Q8_9HYPH|nr:hypothetical protein [Methylobacterium aerolatum]